MPGPDMDNHQETRFTGYHVKLIILMLFALLLVIFAIQNAHSVTIKLWFWQFHASMALALIICLVSGFLLSFFYFLPLLQKKDDIIGNKDREIARLKGNASRPTPPPRFR
jgi:lipopolysaccharide assembly protein A